MGQSTVYHHYKQKYTINSKMYNMTILNQITINSTMHSGEAKPNLIDSSILLRSICDPMTGSSLTDRFSSCYPPHLSGEHYFIDRSIE